jgi:hypothetical protein
MRCAQRTRDDDAVRVCMMSVAPYAVTLAAPTVANPPEPNEQAERKRRGKLTVSDVGLV